MLFRNHYPKLVVNEAFKLKTCNFGEIAHAKIPQLGPILAWGFEPDAESKYGVIDTN